MGTKISELPSSAALTGAEQVPLVQSATTKQSLLSTIAAWVIKTYAGFLQSGMGAVATPVQDELRNLPSVTQFGASTSASAATNTTAFNNAIAAHSVIFVPGAPGDIYDLNALNTITTAKIIWGQGATLRFNTTSDAIVLNCSTGSPAQSARCIIKGLQFDNLTNTPSSFIKSGSSGSGSLNALIEECQFSECAATYCIDNAIGYGMKIRNCTFTDVTGSAIRFQDSLNQSSAYSFVASIDGCDITRASGDGIYIEGAHVMGISNTVIESCGGAGIITKALTTQTQAWNINLSNVYFENNTGNDIDFSDCSASYWTQALLEGCQFTGTPTIALGSKSKVTIIASANGGGATCTISGSSNASVVIIGESSSYAQSGTFNWVNIDFTDNTTVPTAYTPSLTNSGASIGNGTLTGSYTRVGGRVSVSVYLLMGSTTSLGSGTLAISLPFTAATITNDIRFGSGRITDTGVADYVVQTYVASAGSSFTATTGTAATPVTATSPMTWGTGDLANFSFEYEAA